jgi:phosphatidylserine/phosphatidylglycerophosphate/cardiolipin synthase-like enzyme
VPRPTKAVFAPVPLGEVLVLAEPRRTWTRLLADIAAAREEVLLENYIVLDGQAADALISALQCAVEAGARVRIVADGAGSHQMTAQLRSRLEQLGEFRVYHPLRLRALFLGIRERVLQRTHRRLVVIDGRIGWTGGLAIEDPWYPGGGKQPVRDTMVRIEGEAAGLLRESFEMLWAGRTPLLRNVALPEPGELSVMPHFARRMNRPGRQIGQMVMTAQRRVWLGTAYFIPTRRIRRALYRATERGLDVRLLLPGAYGHDHQIARYGARRYYGRLLKRGVRIYEYQPSFFHAKLILVDDDTAMVGTMNLDRWSFFFNHEIGVLMRDPAAAAALDRQFRADFGRSVEIQYSEWRRRPIRERIAERFSGLFDRWL